MMRTSVVRKAVLTLRLTQRLTQRLTPRLALRLTLTAAVAVACAAQLPAQSPAAPAPAAAPIPSMPLRTFQDSMGINTHVEYTDGKYADAQKVLADLEYLGIHSVRDGIPNSQTWLPHGQGLAAIDLLAAHGIRFDFLADGNQPVPGQILQLDDLVKAYPGVALSVEGPNEINNFPVKPAVQTARPEQPAQAAEAFQRSLYRAVHADPLLRGVPVYYMTGAPPVDLVASPGLAEFANTHPYPHHGQQPFSWLNRDFPLYFKMSGAYARVITETGYYTDPASAEPGGVDDQAQAEMVLNSYFDGALQGNSYTYLYQLLDAYPDPKNNNSDNHFGFFRLNGSPKPIARALHVLSQTLPLDQPSPQQAPLARVLDLPATAHALALTASHGAIIVFLWNEVPVWDAATRKSIAADPVPVHVTLPGEWKVQFFSPLPVAPQQAPQSVHGTYSTSLYPFPVALIFRTK